MFSCTQAGGDRLRFSKHVSERMRRLETYEQMDVVRYAANGLRNATERPNHSAKIGV